MQDLFHMKLCTKSCQISYSLGAADTNSKISCSVAFNWYIVHRQSVFICRFWEKLPFALGGKRLKAQSDSSLTQNNALQNPFAAMHSIGHNLGLQLFVIAVCRAFPSLNIKHVLREVLKSFTINQETEIRFLSSVHCCVILNY